MKFIATILAGLFVASTAVANAALGTGSLLNGTMDQNLSSNHAYVGQTVTLSNVTSDDGSGTVTHGKLYGSVTSVQAAGQGRPGKIAFTFTRLVTGNGTTYSVDSTVTKANVQTKSNALKEAGGAVAGMLVGNMLSKTIFRSSVGGFLGAAGGFLIAKNSQQNVNVPSGSIIQVRLNAVTRRQSR